MSTAQEEEPVPPVGGDDEPDPDEPSGWSMFYKAAKAKVSSWSTNVQWATNIKVAMGLVSTAFIVFVVMGLIQEAQNGVGTYPGIGTALIILPFYVMGMALMYAVSWSIVKGKITDLDYLEIFYVCPPSMEQVYDKNGDEREKSMDADELEQQRWTGILPDPEYIDVPDDTLKAIVHEASGLTADARLKLEKQIQDYLAERKKIKALPGREYYMYYFRYNKWAYFTDRDEDSKKRPTPFCDALVILPAMYAEAYRFSRHRVPANGFRILHSHSERVEHVLKDVTSWNLPIFVCTTCGYVRYVNQKPVRAPDALIQCGIIDASFYFCDSQRSKLRGLEQAVSRNEADKDVGNDMFEIAKAKAMMDLMKGRNGAERMRDDYARSQQPRVVVKSGEGAIIGAVIAIVVAAVMFMLWLMK